MRPAVLSLALAGLLAGCRPGPSRPPDLSALPTPEAALGALQAKGAARKNLRAMARVTYFGKKGRVRVRATVLAERPGRFRIETISPFEQPIHVMASNGSLLWLLAGGRLAEGPATPDNVARLLPLSLTPSEVVDVLLGGVPVSPDVVAKTLGWSEDGDRWVLELDAPGGVGARLEVDPKGELVRRLELLEPGGGLRLRIDFGDHVAQASGPPLPEDIRVTIPAGDLDVRIKLLEAEVDVAIDPSLFRLEGPAGRAPEPFDTFPTNLLEQ